MLIPELLKRSPVIPVLVVDTPEHAVPLATALLKGGVSVLEVTLRTPRALAVIAAMSQVDGTVVGAGTVTSGQSLRRAVDAGARFAVSPGLSEDLLVVAQELDVPLLPGVMTPSEVMHAQAQGFEYLKLFPAGAAGGPALLKALAGPFPNVFFCPTGGIDGGNASDYLALKNVVCVGGSWLAPPAFVEAGKFSAITSLCRKTLAALA